VSHPQLITINHITFINTINPLYNHTHFKATLNKGAKEQSLMKSSIPIDQEL
jgi:hypothetical protein